MRKNFFNMVEIALAMAIIGIGISSILVLFPVGINAGRGAVADNNLADVSEYMISYIRQMSENNWNSLQNLPTSKPEVTSSYNDELAEGKNLISKGNGVFLFRQISKIKEEDGTYTLVCDFDAVIKVWRSDISDLYVSDSTRAETISNTDGMRVNMEISWPASIPYENREKRFYQIDLFNQL